MNAAKRTSPKMFAAIIGGSAMVALGALGVTIADQSAGTQTVSGAGMVGMTLGATTTTITPAAAPSVAFAAPPIKAKPYGGS